MSSHRTEWFRPLLPLVYPITPKGRILQKVRDHIVGSPYHKDPNTVPQVSSTPCGTSFAFCLGVRVVGLVFEYGSDAFVRWRCGGGDARCATLRASIRV